MNINAHTLAILLDTLFDCGKERERERERARETKQTMSMVTRTTNRRAKFTMHDSKLGFLLGSVIIGPLTTITHSNVRHDDSSKHNDDQDIGVIGKGNLKWKFIDMYTRIYLAVHLPQRNRFDLDGTRLSSNSSTIVDRFIQDNDSVDLVSDEFDSDSKENENV
jgi:hypothetical protein